MYLSTNSTYILFLFTVFLYIAHKSTYWSRKCVPYYHYYKFTILNFEFLQKPYEFFKSRGQKYFGVILMLIPFFVVTDLNLIKQILNRDFQHFNDHGLVYDEENDPLSAHLINLKGDKWKKLRMKLTPTFTSGKMKMMFPTLIDSSKQMIDYVNQAALNRNSLDIKNVLACYTTDVIGSCAFGIKCNSFADGDAFRKYGKKFFDPNLWISIQRLIVMNFPQLIPFMKVREADDDVSKFFINVLESSVKYREVNDFRRNDFLQLLIDLKNKKNVDNDDNNNVNQQKNVSITFNELLAQAFVFFLAGFETSSTTMTFCLYELAVNQDIQEKLREEINIVLERHNNEITYDSVMDMKYLQQAIDETLRMHPPVPILLRKCTEDYVVPDSNLLIEKDTRVLIPVYQMHYDEEYFPEPEKFEPDRFSDVNKSNIKSYTYLPFGEGPRICIGLRFAMLQTKVGLISLLRNFRFTLDQSTKESTVHDPRVFILSFKDIRLNVERLE